RGKTRAAGHRDCGQAAGKSDGDGARPNPAYGRDVYRAAMGVAGGGRNDFIIADSKLSILSALAGGYAHHPGGGRRRGDDAVADTHYAEHSIFHGSDYGGGRRRRK